MLWFSCCIVVHHVLTIMLHSDLQGVSVGRRRLSADFQLLFRLIKGSIFITFLAIFIILIAFAHVTLKDIVVCILAVMPTGWGLLLVSQFYWSLLIKLQVFRWYNIIKLVGADWTVHTVLDVDIERLTSDD